MQKIIIGADEPAHVTQAIQDALGHMPENVHIIGTDELPIIGEDRPDFALELLAEAESFGVEVQTQVSADDIERVRQHRRRDNYVDRTRRIKLSALGWQANLPRAVEMAREGDTILCPNEIAVVAGKRLCGKTKPTVNIMFDVRPPSRKELEDECFRVISETPIEVPRLEVTRNADGEETVEEVPGERPAWCLMPRKERKKLAREQSKVLFKELGRAAVNDEEAARLYLESIGG